MEGLFFSCVVKFDDADDYRILSYKWLNTSISIQFSIAHSSAKAFYVYVCVYACLYV